MFIHALLPLRKKRDPLKEHLHIIYFLLKPESCILVFQTLDFLEEDIPLQIHRFIHLVLVH